VIGSNCKAEAAKCGQTPSGGVWQALKMLKSAFRQGAGKCGQRQSNGLKMNWSDLASRLEYWGHRIGSYLLLSFADDPAWLAFMFC
jgi:hypothetical protein